MITIRSETAEDIPAVHRVNELAFGRPSEADLVDELRIAAHPQISLVAEREKNVVGHIFFSLVTMSAADSGALVFGLAPMAILPEYQRQGIGTELVWAGLKECRRLGCVAVVVVGHPQYYPRFGFIPASQKGLTCEYDVPDDVFMVAELKPNAVTGGGLIKYHSAFGNL